MMTTQDDRFDPTLDPDDSFGANAMPDDQADDLKRTGNRGNYGNIDRSDQGVDARRAIDSDDQHEGDYSDDEKYSDDADPANAD